MDVHIREMTKEDLPMVAALEQECFSAPWSEQALYESMMREEYSFFVAENNHCIGYASAFFTCDEENIVNIAVTSEARHKGVGHMLMEKLEQSGKNRDIKNVFLEVRSSNTDAIALYESMGYELLGKRKNFYTKPVEDGAIYLKKLQ